MDLDLSKIVTREKAAALVEKIAQGLEENRIVGSAKHNRLCNERAWAAGFEEGRKYQLPNTSE